MNILKNKVATRQRYDENGDLIDYTDCSQCTYHDWDWYPDTGDEFEICTINDKVESTKDYIETELYCDGICKYFEEL